MKCIHKIIMTGTPLQNNLMEFHTLMGICKPLLLGDADSFHQKFALPINRGKHRDADPDYKKESTQLASVSTFLILILY
ncbi:hypothetical protein HU200_062440 [Digitaria exilis]|uniref:SNF2 N-terminal domain-containing protein n=1 Tax=Digitaria exilis TaxID=1010633 RepID=A0A835AA77_9POAL|nr:hypothetical protein HU200_062440 [Digitaria exilis]